MSTTNIEYTHRKSNRYTKIDHINLRPDSLGQRIYSTVAIQKSEAAFAILEIQFHNDVEPTSLMSQFYLEYGARLTEAEDIYRISNLIPIDAVYDILEETVNYFNLIIVKATKTVN